MLSFFCLLTVLYLIAKRFKLYYCEFLNCFFIMLFSCCLIHDYFAGHIISTDDVNVTSRVSTNTTNILEISAFMDPGKVFNIYCCFPVGYTLFIY